MRFPLEIMLCRGFSLTRSRKDAYGIFYEPVPDDVPGYHDTIKHPMAFTDMKAKLDAGKYRSPASFQVVLTLMQSRVLFLMPLVNVKTGRPEADLR